MVKKIFPLVCLLGLSFTVPAIAASSKAKFLTDTLSSANTVPFINAGPADDSTAATALGVQVNGVEMMRVTATGSVGIGTTSPANLLTVTGTIQTTAGGIKYPDGNTQVQAFQTINASYYSNSSTSVPSDTFTTMTFGTKFFDSNNAFSGTTFTAPVEGIYHFHAQGGFVQIDPSIPIGARLLKNGSTTYGYTSVRSQAIGSDVTLACDALISLAAGDTVVFQTYQATGSSKSSRSDSSDYFDVFRVGN